MRANPSSGNLHPTEGYVALGPVAELSDAAGVYHYAADEHALPRVRAISPSMIQICWLTPTGRWAVS